MVIDQLLSRITSSQMSLTWLWKACFLGPVPYSFVHICTIPETYRYHILYIHIYIYTFHAFLQCITMHFVLFLCFLYCNYAIYCFLFTMPFCMKQCCCFLSVYERVLFFHEIILFSVLKFYHCFWQLLQFFVHLSRKENISHPVNLFNDGFWR